jgi:hypothetical protein
VSFLEQRDGRYSLLLFDQLAETESEISGEPWARGPNDFQALESFKALAGQIAIRRGLKAAPGGDDSWHGPVICVKLTDEVEDGSVVRPLETQGTVPELLEVSIHALLLSFIAIIEPQARAQKIFEREARISGRFEWGQRLFTIALVGRDGFWLGVSLSWEILVRDLRKLIEHIVVDCDAHVDFRPSGSRSVSWRPSDACDMFAIAVSASRPPPLGKARSGRGVRLSSERRWWKVAVCERMGDDHDDHLGRIFVVFSGKNTEAARNLGRESQPITAVQKYGWCGLDGYLWHRWILHPLLPHKKITELFSGLVHRFPDHV